MSLRGWRSLIILVLASVMIYGALGLTIWALVS